MQSFRNSAMRILLALEDFLRVYRVILIVSCIGCIIFSFLIYFFSKPTNVSTAAWFDETYSYRKSIVFTNTGSLVTNQKVLIQVDTRSGVSSGLINQGKLQSSCQDFRFTNQAGQELAYFLNVSGGAGVGCDDSSTDIYVLVPIIIVGTNTVYMYYGNTSAASKSSSSVNAVATFSPGTGPTAASEESSPGPVAYWKFDEGTGSNANDASGRNQTGSITAASWKSSDMCVSSTCLSFDGSTAFIQATGTNILKPTNNLTVSAWIRSSSTDASGADILSMGDNYGLRVNTNGTVSFFMRVSGLWDSLTTTTSILDSGWHHIVGVLDDTNNYMRIYIDGLQAAQVTQTSTVVYDQGSNFFIGKHGNAGTTYDFNGFIDEVKVYNFAKSSAQIQTETKSRGSVKGTASQMGAAPLGESLSQGLVGYWKMDESSWTIDCSTSSVTDSSGNGNHGKSCPTSTGPSGGAVGRFSSAGTFDGSNDYVEIADNTSLDPSTAISFGGWVKSTANAGLYYSILLKPFTGSTGGNEQYFIQKDQATGYIYAGIKAGGSMSYVYSTTSWTNIQNTWTHVMVTYDSQNFRMYVNGNLEGTTSKTGSLNTDTVALGLGGHSNTNFTKFVGSLDEVRIYNRSLSAAEVSTLYNWAPGPVGHWKMDENTGTTVNDSSGNSNTGTLTSGPRWTSGKYGSGVGFDGIDDFITTPDSVSLSPTSSLTMDGWVRMGAAGFSGTSDSNQGIVDKGDYQFYLSKSDGKAYWVLNDAAADAFSAFSQGMNGYVYSLAVWNGDLYLGGSFTDTGALDVTNCNYICKWNGSSFSALSQGMNGTVSSLVLWKGDLYLGGSFTDTGATDVTNCNYICKWNGSTFSALSQGMNGSVSAFAVWNGELFLGGSFSDTGAADVANCNYICKWNGSSFSALSQGMNQAIYALSVWNGDLYLGGGFTDTGALDVTNCNYICKWNGSSFSALSQGMNVNGNVYSLAVWNGDLYLAGIFTDTDAADCANCNYVAKWNGSTFSALAQGMITNTFSLAVWNGDLYLGGNFTDTGALDVTNCNYVCKWNGSTFSALSQGTNAIVYTMAVWNGDLYLGGQFNDTGAADCANCNYVAKWGTVNTKSVATSTSSWTANTWYYVAATYDQQYLRIFVNGSLQSSIASSITLEDNSKPLLLGKMSGSQHSGVYSADSSGELFSGALDDIRIYNYARTSKQIIEDMNGGHPAGGSPVGSYVARYKFDDMQGTTAQDSTDNNLDLTLSSASWTTSGKFNGAWNGTGSVWTSIADTPSLDFAASTDFSLSLWVKSDSGTNPVTNDQVIIQKKAAGDAPGYRMYFANSTGLLTCDLDDDTTSYPEDTATTTTDYYDASWHHIVCVRDIISGKLNLYVDGKLAGQDTSLSATGTLENATSFYIGDDDGDATNSFAGDIDEVKVYRSALTASDTLIDMNDNSSITLGGVSDNTNEGFSGNPPVGWWKLDDNTGVSTTDVSGNSQTGTLTNGPVWKSGKMGTALDFDGINDYVQITDTNTLDISSSHTIEAWVNPRTLPNATRIRNIFGKTGDQDLDTAGTQSNYGIALDNGLGGAGQGIMCGFEDAANADYSVRHTTTLPLNQWSHVVCVFDDTANTMTVYVNGIFGTQAAATGTPATQAKDAYIGISNASELFSFEEYFDGKIDDVRLYNYARSYAQVVYDYNRGAPTAWYKFDECQGATAYNAVLNSQGQSLGLNGTITPGASGNTSTGSCNSGTTTEMWDDGVNIAGGRTGKYENALGFDGTDDYVDVADDSKLRFDASTENFSIFSWVKRNATGVEQYIVNKLDAANDGWFLRYDAANTITCGVNATTFSSSATVTDTTWHHVGCIFDRAGNGQAYIDGKATGTATAISGLTMATTSVMRMAARSYTVTSYLNGVLDDVRIYNYVSPSPTAWVQRLYNEGSAVRFGPLTGSP